MGVRSWSRYAVGVLALLTVVVFSTHSFAIQYPQLHPYRMYAIVDGKITDWCTWFIIKPRPYRSLGATAGHCFVAATAPVAVRMPDAYLYYVVRYGFASSLGIGSDYAVFEVPGFNGWKFVEAATNLTPKRLYTEGYPRGVRTASYCDVDSDLTNLFRAQSRSEAFVVARCGPALWYGSSGSPALDLETGKVVGIATHLIYQGLGVFQLLTEDILTRVEDVGKNEIRR